jgi:hypothetical protein
MVTMTVTLVVLVTVIGGALLKLGIVTIEKRDVSHNKTVMIDGVVTETKDWNELLGYDVKIDVVDGVYIGR